MSRSAPRHAVPKHARTGSRAASSASSSSRSVDLGQVRHHATTPVRTRSGLSRAAGIAAVTAAFVAIAGGGYVLSEPSSADTVASGVTTDVVVVTMSPSASSTATATPTTAPSVTAPVPTRAGTASPAPSLTSMNGAGTVALSPDTLAARRRAADAAAGAAAAKKAQAAQAAQAAQDATNRAAAAARSSRSADRQAPPSESPKAIAPALMATYGWGDDQFACLVTMWNHESGWNPNAQNAGSGAYGIPQSLPGSKMAKYGSDWRTNPATQISWGLDYIKTRYSTPCGAWSFWQRGSWY